MQLIPKDFNMKVDVDVTTNTVYLVIATFSLIIVTILIAKLV